MWLLAKANDGGRMMRQAGRYQQVRPIQTEWAVCALALAEYITKEPFPTPPGLQGSCEKTSHLSRAVRLWTFIFSAKVVVD